MVCLVNCMFACDHAKYATYYACVLLANRYNHAPSLRLALNFKLIVRANRARVTAARLLGRHQLTVLGMPVWYRPSSWVFYKVA